MTQAEKNQKYSNLAARMGDMMFRYETAATVLKDLEQQMNALRAEKKALEEAPVDAVEVPSAPAQ